MTDKLLINGELVSGAKSLEVINPATGQPFTTCARADSEQLEQAITSAHTALNSWSAKSFEERGELMRRLATKIEDRADDFAELLTKEQGKPLAHAQGEIGGAIAALYVFSNMKINDKLLKKTETERITQYRTPLGVVAAIAPWNVPLLLMMMKVAPALITGNVVISKPASTTPLTTLLFGEIAAEVLPPGVLSVVTDSNDLGSELTQHPLVSKISFTGSTATGKKVMASAANTLKRLTLELGGNDAAVVLDDADLNKAAEGVFSGSDF